MTSNRQPVYQFALAESDRFEIEYLQINPNSMSENRKIGDRKIEILQVSRNSPRFTDRVGTP